MLLWQVAERGAHQEGQPPMAGGDLVLWPLWEEDETVPGSDQGNVAFVDFFRKAQTPFLGPSGNKLALSALGLVLLVLLLAKGVVGL